jgi:DNA helicase-2/ATP-dependent DNA helicase PcrA
MTRARDHLYLVQPHRFYVKNRADRDAHVFAPRTRFVPDELLPRFEQRAHVSVLSRDTAPVAATVTADLQARLKAMWT